MSWIFRYTEVCYWMNKHGGLLKMRPLLFSVEASGDSRKMLPGKSLQKSKELCRMWSNICEGGKALIKVSIKTLPFTVTKES